MGRGLDPQEQRIGSGDARRWSRRASTVRITSPLAFPASKASAHGVLYGGQAMIDTALNTLTVDSAKL